MYWSVTRRETRDGEQCVVRSRVLRGIRQCAVVVAFAGKCCASKLPLEAVVIESEPDVQHNLLWLRRARAFHGEGFREVPIIIEVPLEGIPASVARDDTRDLAGIRGIEVNESVGTPATQAGESGAWE